MFARGGGAGLQGTSLPQVHAKHVFLPQAKAELYCMQSTGRFRPPFPFSCAPHSRGQKSGEGSLNEHQWWNTSLCVGLFGPQFEQGWLSISRGLRTPLLSPSWPPRGDGEWWRWEWLKFGKGQCLASPYGPIPKAYLTPPCGYLEASAKLIIRLWEHCCPLWTPGHRKKEMGFLCSYCDHKLIFSDAI